MKREEILAKLNEIFKDEFDDDELVIEETTNALDIEDWDSLAQMNLIVAIEHTFQMKFNMGEVNGIENVGEMIDIIIEGMEA